MRQLNLLISLAVLLVVVCPAAAKLKVNPATKQFIDDNGQIRIFHGVNVAYKIPPYLPPITDHFDFDKSFSDADAVKLKAWGMNVVRLTVYWEAIEPVRGKYQDAYLDKVQEIVDICAQHDIAVYIDMHQDVANKQFCGEGMPDWAIKPNTNFLTKFPAPFFGMKLNRDEKGYPTLESCLKHEFGLYYATYAVEDAYENLFDNWDGIGDAFGNMWAHIATRFKNHKNVIGYEIINEPFIGNLYKNPLIVLINDKVMSFYHTVHAKIRAVDNQTIIFYEHPTTDTIFHAVHGSPGGPDYNDRQVLSYHIYPSTMGDPKDAKAANLATNLLYNHAFKILDKEDAMGMLTEFGAISGLVAAGNDNMKYVLDYADKRLHSWSYWQYKYYDDYTTAARPSECEGFFDGNGTVIDAKLKIITRPYVQSSNLDIKTMFVSYSHGLRVEFHKSANPPAGQVILYLNEDYHYTKGPNCKFSECDACKVIRATTDTKHYFVLDHSAAGEGDFTLICNTYSF